MPPSFKYEIEAFALGFGFIAGIDEVGRGCLAGPVVAAAVILPKSHTISDLNDSKLLSAQKREELSERIYQEAVSIGIGSVSPELIDEMNILQASMLAMKKAVAVLQPKPDFLLVDGNLKQLMDIPQKSIIQGDKLCQSIAAASIVAKVFRDRLMKDLHERYPHYNFHSNKGYPTTVHLKALREYGMTEIHRKTFRGVKELL